MPRKFRYNTKSGQPPNQGIPPGANQTFRSAHRFPTHHQTPNMYRGQLPPQVPRHHYWYGTHPVQLRAAQYHPSYPYPHPPLYPQPAAYYQPRPYPHPPLFPQPAAYYQQQYPPNAPVYGGCPPDHPVPPPNPLFGAREHAPGVSGGTGSTLPVGARVRGEVPVWPNHNSGYIFGQKQVVFNLIQGNVKPWKDVNCEIKFQTSRADCRMKLLEFMQQLGLTRRAPPRANPLSIGICEVIETGDGVWQRGTKFTMADLDKHDLTLEQIGWDEMRGEAGKGKPVWLVALP